MFIGDCWEIVTQLWSYDVKLWSMPELISYHPG
jgi:hypothetical protein